MPRATTNRNPIKQDPSTQRVDVFEALKLSFQRLELLIDNHSVWISSILEVLGEERVRQICERKMRQLKAKGKRK
jgi:DNA-binding MarR family transcriptional regulator